MSKARLNLLMAALTARSVAAYPTTRRFSTRYASMGGTLSSLPHMLTEQNITCKLKAVIQKIPMGLYVPEAQIAELPRGEPFGKTAISRVVAQRIHVQGKEHASALGM